MLQVAKYSERGLRVAYITGEQEDEEVKKRVRDGYFQLVFFTPEVVLLNYHWRQLLSTPVYAQKLRALVFDEAHTIKKWLEAVLYRFLIAYGIFYH